jgi:CRISPR system Cascade subunit CasE
MSLHLVQCHPDPRKLATWATRHGLLSPDGDYGYALHALLTAAFGKQAPKPFCYLGTRQGLLGYSELDAAALKISAGLATPDVAGALELDGLDARPFPTAWRNGQLLGFEIRVRPVVRTNDGRERDAYLHALEKASLTSATPQRESTYGEWLNRHLQTCRAATILNASMDGFRLARVVRRSRDDKTGERKLRGINGPVALFSGQLQVNDGDAFARLVTSGIGRHRSFGFGMLLLRPVQSC